MNESALGTKFHTDKSFDNQLTDINSNLLEMGKIVTDMLEIARKTIDNASDDLVKEARKMDKKLNALDFGVQQGATTMIALRQPMGVDLRFLVGALKISSSLERMGDLAKSSCRKANKFKDRISPEISNDLREMCIMSTKMVNEIMNAFRDMNPEKATDVLDQDDEVDEIYHELLRDIQTHAEKTPDLIPALADIIFAAKNFERIGDHCTKMADLVHYISSGEHVGKMAERQKELEKQGS